MVDIANLVRMTVSGTPGTGTITLGSAVQGFLTPAQAGMVNARVYSYAIEADYVTVGDDLLPTSRETGTGTYTSSGTTLTRSVINSTNGNALLNLTSDAQVIIALNVNSSGDVNIDAVSGDLAVKGTTASTDYTLGSLTVGGGAGIAGDVYTNGILHINGGTNALNANQGTGALTIYQSNFYYTTFQGNNANSVIGFAMTLRDGGGSLSGAQALLVAQSSGFTIGAPGTNQPIVFQTNDGANNFTTRFSAGATVNTSSVGLARGIATKTADFTVADTDTWLINNKSGSTCTVTLPAAASYTGRELHFESYQAFTTVSASANVVQKGGATTTTAILPATVGAWATLISNGTNWVIFRSGT